ncbi:MAG: TetR/AcrR family transcriptional regulator [Chitinophagaceae bacterium]
MSSKDRILKLKEDTRCNILNASLDIVKEEGWPALSMRKIADKIDYTAPTIYEYFSNKEALLQELTRMGYIKLAVKMEEARSLSTSPEGQLEAMWLAYWNFAFDNKELYKVMYGVEVNCCACETALPETQRPMNMLWDKIEEITPADRRNDEYVDLKYYTFWSVVHGLISINLTRQITSQELNRQVLRDAISGIIRSIKN